MAYTYDGTFPGFLSCVYESYVNSERPVCFSTFDDPRITLWPERAVETDEEHGERVYRSLSQRISLDAQRMVRDGFLTCLGEKERHLYEFIRLGYKSGPSLTRDLTDDRVAVVWKALQHLDGEAHLLKGFLRFSEQDGFLIAEIEPKNRVLSLLRPHFCARFSGEKFAIYDRVHKEALFYEPHHWAIVPMDDFQVSAPGQTELGYRRLWRRFYDTVAIEDRYNPKCRMTHMPKRYWNTMTEFQHDEGPALPAPHFP
ncbi:MAG: DNA metabolism protein [Clostridia bacterium]|nr:DNA metabolism protein [Clostridia bacterium]